MAKWGTAVAPYQPRPHITRYDQPVLALTASNQDMYFHWLIDCLPRLLRMREGLAPDTLVYAKQVLPFQRASLALAGIPKERIIDAGRIGVLSARRLIVPCHQFARGHLLPQWVIAALRGLIPAARLAAPVGPGQGHRPNRRLFISRQDARHRRVVNEGEIFALMQPHGFVRLRLSHMSFAEQIVAFADAEIVIAPHGGGLGNLVFCQPGTAVVELLPQVNIGLFNALCASAGLNYSFLKSANLDLGAEWQSLRDFVVDQALVTELLATLYGQAERKETPEQGARQDQPSQHLASTPVANRIA